MAKVHASTSAIPALNLRKRFTALFGILALFGMMLLATWHDALPHVNGAPHSHTVSFDHHADASGHNHIHASGHDNDDGDGDIVHVAAHAVVQGVDLPAQPVVGMTLVAAAILWTMAPAKRIDSVKPDSLLRPPRA